MQHTSQHAAAVACRRPVLSVSNTRSAHPGDSRRQRPGLAVASASFPGLAVISAAGELESTTVPALTDVVETASRASCHVVLNLSRVTFFDRAGFRECVAYQRLCRKNRRTLALVNPAPIVRRVVRALDVHRVLAPFATAHEASRALARRRSI